MSTFIDKKSLSVYADALTNQDLSFFKSLDNQVGGENYYEEIEELFEIDRVKKSGLAKYFSRIHNTKVSSKLILKKLREYNNDVFKDENAVRASSGEEYYNLPKSKYQYNTHSTPHTSDELTFNTSDVFIPPTREQEIEFEHSKRREFTQALINKDSSYFTKKFTRHRMDKARSEVVMEAITKDIIPIREFCDAYSTILPIREDTSTMIKHLLQAGDTQFNNLFRPIPDGNAPEYVAIIPAH